MTCPHHARQAEKPRHRVRIRNVVEQNVEVEADDPVQARKLARDPRNWLSENEPVRVSEVTVPQASQRRAIS